MYGKNICNVKKVDLTPFSIRMNQIEAAKRLGISYQAYQRLENPNKCNPTIKTLERVARIFGKELYLEFA